MCDNSVFSIFPPAPAQGTVTVCEQHGGLLSSPAQSKPYKKVRRLLLLLTAITFIQNKNSKTAVKCFIPKLYKAVILKNYKLTYISQVCRTKKYL